MGGAGLHLPSHPLSRIPHCLHRLQACLQAHQPQQHSSKQKGANHTNPVMRYVTLLITMPAAKFPTQVNTKCCKVQQLKQFKEFQGKSQWVESTYGGVHKLSKQGKQHSNMGFSWQKYNVWVYQAGCIDQCHDG